MIVFDNVSKKFSSGTVALDGISFDVEDKEFVFLIGESGAGKTTILKLILRDYLPTLGSILVDELNISDKKFKQTYILRRKIGMVFQDFKILFDKNIFENVALSIKIINNNHGLIKKEVREALALTGIANKENFFPIQLSAGELQRLAIARAICGERKIILADEPTGNLDPKTAWEIMKIFKRLEDKKTIIFATHNTEIVNSFKKRVMVLKRGKLVKDTRKGGYDI